MAPLFTGSKIGFGRVDSISTITTSSTQISNSYLLIPFNENSTSHTLFGGYASSLTTTAGGTYNTSIHPYSITDSTYNSGNNTAYRCQAACDVFYISNSNSILGSLGTSDFCFDFWFNWRGYGNGGGSYGAIGDYNYGSCGSKSGTGSSAGQYFYVGAAGDANVQYAWGNSNGTINLTVSNTNQWYHYMLIRQSGIFYIFLDGVLKIVNTSDTGDSISNGGGWTFGTFYRNDSPHYWDVNIADVMFTRDSDCQYSLNSTTSSDINTSFFTRPQYKNKIMSSSLVSKFTNPKKPSGFS